MQVSDELYISIEEMAYGGDGLGFVDGKAVFVQGALAGERVLARIIKVGERFCQAIALGNIHKTSCEHSDACGGCPFLPLSYSEQLKWKKKFVSDALTRIAGLKDLPDFPIIAQGSTHHYRNRIQLRCHVDANGSLKLGYFRPGTHELVSIKSCYVADKAIDEAIQYLRTQKLSVKGVKKFRMHLQSLPATKQVVALIEPINEVRGKADSQLVAAIKKAFSGMNSVVFVGELHEARCFDFETEQGIHYETKAGIFQQVNVLGNHALRKWVLDVANEFGGQKILDLFCGSGNLSLQLADGNRKVVGVEYSKAAIEVALANVKKNRLSGISYFADDAAKFLGRVTEEFDVVIADPPRAGLKDLVPDVLRLKPKVLVLVSCDPTTLARDVKAMGEYKVQRLAAFDFFPHTYHVETAAVLVRA